MTIQELEEQIKVLQEEIEKMKVAEKEKKSSKWKPKVGERYYFISNSGNVDWLTWYDDDFDVWRYNNMPIFQTEAECEQYKKFREDVKTRSYEFNEEEWEDINIQKYFIYFSYAYKNHKIASDLSGMSFSKIYFKTEEDAQYIIDTYPEELRKWRV